jgi:hypothetical protein
MLRIRYRGLILYWQWQAGRSVLLLADKIRADYCNYEGGRVLVRDGIGKAAIVWRACMCARTAVGPMSEWRGITGTWNCIPGIVGCRFHGTTAADATTSQWRDRLRSLQQSWGGIHWRLSIVCLRHPACVWYEWLYINVYWQVTH